VRIVPALIALLVVVFVAIGVLALAIISPTTQTWYVARALGHHPNLHATIESAALGASTAQLTNLRLERDGAVLTVPSLTAQLPIKSAVWSGKLALTSLTAKGWTLDLTPVPPQPQPQPTAGATAAAAGPSVSPPSPQTEPLQLFRKLLADAHLPAEASITAVDLDGEIILGTPTQPIRCHVTVKGGPLVAGQEGTFAMDALVPVPTVRSPDQAITLHGQLAAALGATGGVRSVRLTGRLAPMAGPQGFDLVASIVAPGAVDDGSCRVELDRGERKLVRVSARLPAASTRVDGTWAIDFEPDEADLLPVIPYARPTSGAGSGRFEFDWRPKALHATGHLELTAENLGLFAAPPARPKAVTVLSDFDLTHHDGSLAVKECHLALGPPTPLLTVDVAQPFELDEQTHRLAISDPAADWIRVGLRSFPLTWLRTIAGNLEFSAGVVSGDFALRQSADGITVHSIGPLRGSQVALAHRGRPLAQALGVTMPLDAQRAANASWTLHTAPLAIETGGRQLATIDLTLASQTDGYGRVPAHGSWSADLDVLREQPAFHWLAGRSATGSFSANLGASGDFTGTIAVAGHTGAKTVTATLSATVDDLQKAYFQIPVKIGTGSRTSDLSIDGSFSNEPDAAQLDVQATASEIAADHLELLYAGLAAGMRLAARGDRASAQNSAGDSHPFWGDLVGRVRFDFRRLDLDKYPLEDVGGTVFFDHATLGLNGGRGVFNPLDLPANRVQRSIIRDDDAKMEPRSLLSAEGTLAFDAHAPTPYALNAVGKLDQVEAWRLLGAPADARDPTIEGQFTLSATLTGHGTDLADLLKHRREELNVSSNAGIVRLLKTNVAESLPEPPAGPSDTLAGVGHAVGSLFGMKQGSPAKVRLNPATEAVLNFSYEATEIGYDRLAAAATREADGAIRLSDIAITSPREHLTGSGVIGKGTATLAQRPLALDLQLAFKGNEAERLATAGLLSGEKDALGYAKLRPAVHFAGTLEHIDNTAWHDLLVAAAMHPPQQNAGPGSPNGH
jgi:hypothetical protein